MIKIDLTVNVLLDLRYTCSRETHALRAICEFVSDMNIAEMGKDSLLHSQLVKIGIKNALYRTMRGGSPIWNLHFVRKNKDGLEQVICEVEDGNAKTLPYT